MTKPRQPFLTLQWAIIAVNQKAVELILEQSPRVCYFVCKECLYCEVSDNSGGKNDPLSCVVGG